ncbi:MAG: TRAP transporter large permease subunit, partial [Burkholderiales bacterium]
GKLLLAGFIPGGLTALGYALAINLILRRRPELAPTSSAPAPWRARIGSLGTAAPPALLMVIVVLAIYTGVVTPTEIGAVGALLALAIGVAMGRIGWRGFVHALVAATRTSAMILVIVVCAAVFAIFLTMTGVTQDLLDAIQAAQINRWMVLVLVLLMLLVLGFFLDQLAILVLTLPLTFPILTGLGFDEIWMGVVFVKTAEIGLITPPMGMNVFVVGSVAEVPAHRVFRGVWPFVLVELVLLALLVAFPQLSLWLPELAAIK